MKKAFTLIELLVIIATTIILILLLIPAFKQLAKEQSTKINRLEQSTQSQTVYHAGDTVWIKRNGEILKGELTHSPER